MEVDLIKNLILYNEGPAPIRSQEEHGGEVHHLLLVRQHLLGSRVRRLDVRSPRHRPTRRDPSRRRRISGSDPLRRTDHRTIRHDGVDGDRSSDRSKVCGGQLGSFVGQCVDGEHRLAVSSGERKAAGINKCE